MLTLIMLSPYKRACAHVSLTNLTWSQLWFRSQFAPQPFLTDDLDSIDALGVVSNCEDPSGFRWSSDYSRALQQLITLPPLRMGAFDNGERVTLRGALVFFVPAGDQLPDMHEILEDHLVERAPHRL